jgi:AmmeMemoRadiSam system protein A
MRTKSRIFICLKIRGQLRGCIGTFHPQHDNIIAETIHNAVSAAVEDPRFSPITLKDLSKINITVDILTPPEPVDSPEQLDPKRYGIIVQRGWRRGLLLPDIEGVHSLRNKFVLPIQSWN